MLLNKNNLDKYLHALALEYRKAKLHNCPLEMILVGGSAIIANYHFRFSTIDADGTGVLIKTAIKKIANKYDLPEDWLNDDFVRTKSYSDKIALYSKSYKLFANVLSVRIVTREYLVAMKLRSFRRYKNDLSDIVGIVYEEAKKGTPITSGEIRIAVNDLYGNYQQIKSEAQIFIKKVLALDIKDLEKIYKESQQQETKYYQQLLEIEKIDKNSLTERNVDIALKQIDKHLSAKEIIEKIKNK